MQLRELRRVVPPDEGLAVNVLLVFALSFLAYVLVVIFFRALIALLDMAEGGGD